MKDLTLVLLLLFGCTSEHTGDLSGPRRSRAPITYDALPADTAKSPDLSFVADLSLTPSPDTTQNEALLDLTPETNPDLTKLDSIVTSDLEPDTRSNLNPDAKKDSSSPDLNRNLPLGTTCSRPSDCNSTYCTDGVCCTVALCVDTCTPGSSGCTPYAGFTCAPYGTCRGF
jgi:hypothetical protein